MGARYPGPVRIIARRTLRDFWEAGHPDAERPLKAWYAQARKASWQSMADIKEIYRSASVVRADLVVFNVGGNKYRLVVSPWFRGQALYVKFVGTHKQYDAVDVMKL
jgi:mRNA interferase HigB